MTALLPWDQPDRTRIGTLRVRGGRESANVRLAVSGTLDRADLRPSGLPPAAVLIVRRMADPLPGRIAAHRRSATADPAWERAARDQFAGLYRRAARPCRGAAPLDADAVIFADESEMLASLALDLVTGRIRERWWWRNFGGSSIASPPTLAALLRERATSTLAAFALLARQNWAIEVVRALSPQEALAVLAAIGQAHGVPAIATPLTSPSAPWTPQEAGAPASASEGASEDERSELSRVAAVEPAHTPGQPASGPSPPWSKFLPSSSVPAELDRPRACLLGIALALHHRPEAVRSAPFAMEFQRWWRSQPTAPARPTRTERTASASEPHGGRAAAAETDRAARPATKSVHADTPTPPQPAAPPTDSTSTARPAPGSEPTVGRTAVTEADAAVTRTIRGARAETATPLQAPAPPVAASTHDGPADPPPARLIVAERDRSMDAASPIITASSFAAGDRRAKGDAEPTFAARGSTEEEPAAPGRMPPTMAGEDAALLHKEPVALGIDDRRPPTATPLADTGLSLESGVETALGGVLFLINAMCALDLPDCFEAEWRLASTVSAWGVLEALGRALLSLDGDDADDPIWAALAVLSGRDRRERLGAGLPRRAAYRLPAAWADQMGDDANQPGVWAARGRRLRVWNRAGYVLSENCRGSPRSARALVGTLPRERFGDAPLASLPGPLIAGIDPALRRWLTLAVPFIRLRLIRALGIDPMLESLQSALLARRGRLYVTATHVDLVMGVNTASLPARRSGLDRNPGWLAAFGRVILFHFE